MIIPLKSKIWRNIVFVLSVINLKIPFQAEIFFLQFKLLLFFAEKLFKSHSACVLWWSVCPSVCLTTSPEHICQSMNFRLEIKVLLKVFQSDVLCYSLDVYCDYDTQNKIFKFKKMFATFKITSTFVGSFYVLTIMICSMTEVAVLIIE